MGLEQVLLALSVAMFAGQLLAWRWSLGVERALEGHSGHELAKLLTWIIGWSTIARLVGVVALAVFDRNSPDSALQLSLVASSFGAMIFVGAAVRIRQISRKVDRDVDPPSTQGGDRGEGVRVEIDQVRVSTTVAVDDRHSNAGYGTYSNALPAQVEQVLSDGGI